jgi:Ran GTPase-activating protein (RanGAP) involved in mRNA processing and transport
VEVFRNETEGVLPYLIEADLGTAARSVGSGANALALFPLLTPALCPRLRTLRLANCRSPWQRVSVLGDLLLQLHKQLEVVDLRANFFHDAAISEALAPPLQALTRLRSFDYSCNNLVDDAAVTALCGALRCLPCLEELRLACCRMDGAGTAKLAATLPRLPRLRVLDASIHLHVAADEGRDDSVGATALCVALPQLPQLTELTLGYTSVSEAAAPMLCDALRSGQLGRLTALAFTSCDFGAGHDSVTQEIMASILRALAAKGVPDLKRLDVGFTTLGSSGAVALATAIPCLPKLESLSLQSCRLNEADGIALFSALVSVPHLVNLVAYGNPIGPKSCAAVAAVMKCSSHLQQLDVSYCDILDEGLQHITSALRYVTQLTQLHLIGNRLTAVGMQALAASLHAGYVPLLTELSLDSNPRIGDAGITALTNALPACHCASRLTALRLYQTGTGRVGVCALARAMVHLPSLKIVNVSLVEASVAVAGSESDDAAETDYDPYSPGHVALSYLLDQLVRLPGVAEGAACDARIVDEIVPCLASRFRGATIDSLAAGGETISTDPSTGVPSLPSFHAPSVNSASGVPLPLRPVYSVLGAWAAEYGWTRRRALVAAWQAAHSLPGTSYGAES